MTLRNRGNEGALITGIELLVTGHYQDQPCGAIGGDLAVSASYDFIVPENPQLPLTLTQGVRNEVPANEYTRFSITLGPDEQLYQVYTDLYSFDVFVRISESDDQILVGQGKIAVDSADLRILRDAIQGDREFAPECAERRAQEIFRIHEMPGISSPELSELVKLTSADHEYYSGLDRRRRLSALRACW